MRRSAKGVAVLALAAWAVLLASRAVQAGEAQAWSDAQVATLRSLWLGSLSPLPDDPSNAYDTDPRAARLGRELFFDTRLSGNRRVSCATCHRADYSFTDNLPLAHGIGTGPRRTMPLAGTAYQAWFFWDGRKDSLWSQALGPIENPLEHGFSRTLCFMVIHEHYKEPYEQVFGPLPPLTEEDWPLNARPAPEDPTALKAWVTMTPEMRRDVNRVYVNMGKAIAAYVRTIVPGPSRFDRYVEALLKGDEKEMKEALSDAEVRGLRLFIGKAKCFNCHNGPLFTNGDFHDVGLPHGEDRGRADGIPQVLRDEFNCLSPHSDAEPRQCAELRFIDTDTEKYAYTFKTPSLRNVALRPPYMHSGHFSRLVDVLAFYRESASGDTPAGHGPSLEHGALTDEEIRALEAFLHALCGPIEERTPGESPR
jgi:cytochrome c peroxidase